MWVQPPTRHEAQAVYQGDGGERTDKGRQGNGPRAGGPGRDRDYGAKTGTAGETQQVWLREWVTDHGLESRTAHRKAPSHKKRQHHPGGAYLTDDRGGGSPSMP